MNSKKLYILANFIIYTLIIILIVLISYDLLVLYKKYSTKIPPKNSINVSPSSDTPTTDVLFDN